MPHLLIDGYNLLHYLESQGEIRIAKAGRGLELEDRRQNLLEKILGYQSRRQVDITIVFDGTDRLGFLPRRTKFGNILVLFSDDKENADRYISRLCEDSPGNYIVVSNDGEVLLWAQQRQCLTMNCREFADRLQTKEQTWEEALSELDPEDFMLEDDRPLYPRVSTKKKGVARRLPKNERRRKNQLKNL